MELLQNGWPVFFCITVSPFSRETVFTKLVSEEIAAARSRHNSRRRRIPMPASPHHRARCNRHESRAGIVALTYCCVVRLSNGGLGPPDEIVSLPACTRRNIRCGAALASRRDPLAFSGDKRGAAKCCFSLCLTEHPFQTQNLSIFHATQTTGPTGASLPSRARISFPTRAAIVPLLDWLPACVAHDFCNPEDPDALGDDSSIFAVTQQQRCACIRKNDTLQTGLRIGILFP